MTYAQVQTLSTDGGILKIKEVRDHINDLHEQRERMLGAPRPPLRHVPPPKPRMPRGSKKISTTLRLSPEVIDAFKASGSGWQTRINQHLLHVVLDGKV